MVHSLIESIEEEQLTKKVFFDKERNSPHDTRF